MESDFKHREGYVVVLHEDFMKFEGDDVAVEVAVTTVRAVRAARRERSEGLVAIVVCEE